MDVADPVLYEEQGFHSLFRELRASDPVHHCERSQYGPYWAITRYADIVAVDLNHRVFSSEAGGISIFDMPVHRDRSFPEEDRYHMLYWTDVQVALIGGQDPGIEEREKHPSFSVYFLDLLRRRASEKERTPDLVSHLIHGEQEISDEMYLNHLRLLMVGANDTTRTSIAGGLEAVIEQGLYADLRGNRALVPTAVNEMIRYVTPVVHQRRTATCDFELGGKKIREGDKVVMFYVSGNRDESAFASPDRLVLDRTEPRILSFGSGIHHCIGFRIAKMQLEYVWEGMLDRFSGFELVDQPVRVRSNFVQGFQSMPVIARP